eukprot:TRINITY_DN35364_c0_g2_i2.p1 TRINITY_DN35364_c0_g2~~TRINITY_DN35364_c0_g2_i2.p1  ORF type:complete len:663 (-),score=85.02 TRINITY_DN35364_c0_g2_i2:292-2280(-)
MLGSIKQRAQAVDIRFERAATELAYRKSLENDMLNFMRVATVAEFCVVVPYACSQALQEMEHPTNPYEFALHDPRSFVFIAWLATSFMCLLYSITAFFRTRFGYMQSANWELITLALLLLGVVCTLGCRQTVLPTLVGQNPKDVWTVNLKDAELSSVLILDGIVTCACLLVPIRACVLWMLPFFVFVVYMLIETCLMEWHPFMPVNMGVVSALCLYAYIGAWRGELSQRERFVAQNANEHLTHEKEAFASLLSLTCEGALWMAPDGDRILRSDRWLDSFMEADMQGRSLGECMLPGDEDRVFKAIRTAAKGTSKDDYVPVSLVPVQIASPRGVTVDVDLFVVDRRAALSKMEERLAFLVGIRLKKGGQGLVEQLQLDVGRHEKVATVLNPLPPADEGEGKESEIGGHPLSHQGSPPSQPTPAQRLTSLKDDGLLLPSTAEVLCFLPGDKLTPAAVTSLRQGDRLYCASLSTDSPVMMPVTIEKIVFLEAASVIRSVRARGDAERKSIELVDSTALLIRAGPLLRWMSWWALKPEQHRVMSVDVATIALGFSAEDLVLESVSEQKETSAVRLWLTAACAPCVRMCNDGAEAASMIFAPVAPCSAADDGRSLADSTSQWSAPMMSSSTASPHPPAEAVESRRPAAGSAPPHIEFQHDHPRGTAL